MRLINRIKKFDENYISVISLLIIWKILLFFAAVWSYEIFPLYSLNYLGGGFNNYISKYYIFPWANFDGEHFVSIAYFGYQELQQAFFPLYPKLIALGMYFYGRTLGTGARIGYLISAVSFPIALIFFYKLLKLDYSRKFSLGVISVLLIYPASFYFNAIYSESLFLMLIILSFYFFRKGKYFWASLFGFLGSLTRVFGVLLFLSFFIEIFLFKIPIKKVFWILLIPAGLGLYMVYLYRTVGDPLAFYNLQLVVGEQHQRGVVLFPQVVYRYLKIIFTMDSLTPLLTTIFFEFAVGLIFFILPIIGYFKKVRLSYLFFAFFGYLLPTVQGSFSSLPRYVLVLFPSFIILALLFKNLPNWVKIFLGSLSAILLLIETALFLRGYWVA